MKRNQVRGIPLVAFIAFVALKWWNDRPLRPRPNTHLEEWVIGGGGTAAIESHNDAGEVGKIGLGISELIEGRKSLFILPAGSLLNGKCRGYFRGKRHGAVSWPLGVVSRAKC
jgi:hypothetical protein